MKTLGMIGGIGPESTVEYYHSIIRLWRERTGDGSYPSIVINSINLNRIVGLFEANDLAGAAQFLTEEIGRLARAGADFGLLSANTPHLVFDQLRRGSPIPLLSIVEATCNAAKRLGLRKPALLGTRFTLQGGFYPAVFARAGMELVVPDRSEESYLHEKYMGELLKGVFLPETHQGLLKLVESLKTREGVDGIILGGTELPLILREPEHAGIPFLDTTQIHVRAAVDEMLR